jgi:hypothetical protein
MDFLSIRITEQSVIAVTENKRRVCPARQPSPKKSPWFRMPIVASFPLCDTNGESYPLTVPCLYVKNGIGQVTLNKDRLLLTKSCDFSPAIDGRKKCLGIEFAEFLSRHHGCCEPPKLSVCEESNFL